MRLCVFGAAGRTGSVFVRSALEQRHAVTVFFRSDSRASPPLGAVTVWGDLDSVPDLVRAVSGADAVITFFGRRPLRAVGTFAPVVGRIVNAMQMAGVSRFLHVTDAIATAGVRRGHLESAVQWLHRMRYPQNARDKSLQEQLVQQSGLDWTIIRGPRLAARTAEEGYRIGPDIRLTLTSRITRSALAQAVLDQAASREFVEQQVIATA